LLRESTLLSIDAALLEARVLLEDDDIELLRWPADAAERQRMAELQVPRLLLLAEDAPPPTPTDLFEDWVRLPLDPDELMARRAALSRRATCAEHAPQLDDDGLLWWGDQWVAIPEAQLPVVELLIARVRDLVRRDELIAAYEARGGSPNPIAAKAMMGRVVKRFAEIGLELRNVRGRGYLLDAPNNCPLHAVAGGRVTMSPARKSRSA
jgi:two-component system, OmpR family, response regulator